MLNRSRKPLRRKAGLKANGRKSRAWRKIKAEVSKKLFEKNIVYCEICGSSDVTPAHLYKRRNCDEKRLAEFAILCPSHHQLFELLGEARNAAILTFIISRRDFEETDVDFDSMNKHELQDFADSLIAKT